MIRKTILFSTRIVKSCAMKKGTPFKFEGNSMETETTTWSEFSNGGKGTVEQTLGLDERNKSKRVRLWGSQSGFRVWKLTIWVKSLEIKNQNMFT